MSSPYASSDDVVRVPPASSGIVIPVVLADGETFTVPENVQVQPGLPIRLGYGSRIVVEHGARLIASRPS